MAIHIDTDGNFWFGQTGTEELDEISYTPVFSVTNAGVLTATSGTVGGWTLGSDYLRAANDSNQYIYLNADGSIAGNFVSGSSGWQISASGDAEFNKVKIRIPSGQGDPPSDETQFISVGSGKIYEYNSDLILDASGTGNDIVIKAGDRFRLSGVSSDPTLLFDGAQGEIEFDLDQVADSTTSYGRSYSSEALGYVNELTFKNQDVNIFRINAQNSDVYFYGQVEISGDLRLSSLRVYDGYGTSGEVLTRTSNGLEWSAAGGAHADSDHTSFATTSQIANFITQSDADSRYVNETDHTHSNLVGDTAFNNHANSSTAHGTFDYYSYWTLRGNPGGNLQTANVGSTGTASIYAGTSMSASMSGSSITLNNTGVTSIGQSGNDGFVTAVSGSTVTTSRDLGTATIETGTHKSNSYGATLGTSTFGDKWYKLWAHNASDTSSDERLKENIVDIDYGLDFINDLRPVEFDWKSVTEYYCEEHPDEKYTKPRDFCSECKKENDLIYMDYLKEKELFDNELIEEEPIEPTFTPCVMLESSKDMNEGKKTWGLIAQEVKTVLGDYQNHLVSHDTESDYYGLAYENLIAPLIKAVQELSTQISELTARVEALEG